ncbi:MAG: hypothetical protein IKH77_06865 [Clostridia bacterium]|nr:hypothetical protein [Clostridia bacterium]
MWKRSLLLLIALLMITLPCQAEVIRLGDTVCLLQPPSGEDSGTKYVLFVGAGVYFHAVRNYRDYTATDGELLIPQADQKYDLPSAASDEVIPDVYPRLLEWAEAGHPLVLIGYSSGGYPATILAGKLAEAGYTGTVYLLDGVYGNYHSTAFNAKYFRSHLSTWDLRIYASSDKKTKISVRTRKVGTSLMEDDFVTYRQYGKNHNGMQDFYDVILNGAPAPEPKPLTQK